MKNSKKLLAFLSLGMLLCACSKSENVEIADLGEMNNTNQNRSPELADVDLISGQLNWETARSDNDRMTEILNMGNSFSFENVGWDTVGNVYGFPVISETNEFGFYFVHESDVGDETKYVYVTVNDGFQNNYPEELSMEEEGETAVSWLDADTRIADWIDETERSGWIEIKTEETAENPGAGVFTYMLIPAIDFENGSEHNCFLALKNGMIDLIVINGVGELYEYKDVSLPVPPFVPNN